MILSTQKIQELSKYRIEKIVESISDFCKVNLGKKKNCEFPQIKLSFKKASEFMGLYNPLENKIIIYVYQISTVSELSKTIIHEWCHSKQDILNKYQTLYRRFGYENHPMEKEAIECEKAWNRKCLYHLRNIFCKK